MEEDRAINLLAFSDYDLKNSDISGEDVDRIKELEEKLGITLVAV